MVVSPSSSEMVPSQVPCRASSWGIHDGGRGRKSASQIAGDDTHPQGSGVLQIISMRGVCPAVCCGQLSKIHTSRFRSRGVEEERSASDLLSPSLSNNSALPPGPTREEGELGPQVRLVEGASQEGQFFCASFDSRQRRRPQTFHSSGGTTDRSRGSYPSTFFPWSRSYIGQLLSETPNTTS